MNYKLDYKKADGVAYVIGKGSFDGAELKIPFDYEGSPVVGIGKGIFRRCESLTSVSIESNVKHIGKNAFDGCTALEKVEIKGCALESIDRDAFRNCKKLAGIVIPSSVKKIGRGAFCGCRGLEKIVFEEKDTTKKSGSVTISIGCSAFFDCASLSGIVFPNRLEEIGDRAFEGCVKLGSVTWEEDTDDESGGKGGDKKKKKVSRLKSIGNFAFRGCRNLTVIKIPGNVKEIGVGAFCECASLERIDGMEGVGYVGYRAFCDCRKLDSVGSGTGLRFMGDDVFLRCKKPEENYDLKVQTPYAMNVDSDKDKRKSKWDGVGDVAGGIDKFMRIRATDDSRYRSYDHVHNAFLGCAGRPGEDETDGLALELFMYLASWGMLRNSFLMYKDYRLLTGVVDVICGDMERFVRLMDVDPFKEDFDSGQYIHDVLELRDEITYCFEDGTYYYKADAVKTPVDSVTDALVSKILLAALGCVPAYDDNVRNALQNLGINGGKILENGKEGLSGLLEFVRYKNMENEIVNVKGMYEERYRSSEDKAPYSVMKYVDMLLWSRGYFNGGNDDEENEDGE